MSVVCKPDEDPVGYSLEAAAVARQEEAVAAVVEEEEAGIFTLIPTRQNSGHPYQMKINNEIEMGMQVRPPKVNNNKEEGTVVAPSAQLVRSLSTVVNSKMI
jgi:hypothetical protein